MQEQSTSIVKDLIELIQDKKVEVRKQALMILIQQEDRLPFRDSDLAKVLLKLSTDDQCQQTVITALIQFSQDDWFRQEVIKFNACQRLAEIVKNTVLEVMQAKREFSENEDILINTSLLALSNLTLEDQGKKQFLQADGHEAARYFYFKMFVGFYLKLGDKFSHFSAILINLTSNEECRNELIKPELKIMELFEYLLQPPPKLRSIQSLKNVLFEYEKDDLKQQFKGNVIKMINEFAASDLVLYGYMFGLEDSPLIKQLKLNSAIRQLTVVESSKKEEVLQRILEWAKCLLILSNAELENQKYDLEELKTIIGLLRNVKEMDQDQLDVIETVFVLCIK